MQQENPSPAAWPLRERDAGPIDMNFMKDFREEIPWLSEKGSRGYLIEKKLVLLQKFGFNKKGS